MEVVWPKLILFAVGNFSFGVNLRPVISAGFFAGMDPRPHAIFVKPVFDGLIWEFIKFTQLPFSSNGCGVSSIAEVVAKSSDASWHSYTFVFPNQRAESGSGWIKPTHDHHSSRSAERRSVGIVEPGAFIRHSI